MKRSCCMVVALVLVAPGAGAGAAWAQLPATYTISNEPPYRDQGSYGTCWTFAALASVETSIIQEGLPGYDASAGLSERDLAWNSGFLAQIGGGLAGINSGGDYLMVAAYLARGAGPLTNAQAPYSSMGAAPPTGQVAPYYVRDIEWYHNTADIKAAVMSYGAVATCWQTSSYTQQPTWSSALNNWVYYDPGPGVSNPGPGYLNQPTHAVAIVGWNDTVQTPGIPGGTGAWIIRNSWGPTNNQHIGVSYNDFYTGHDTPDTGACSAGAVSFHNVVPNTYQQVYYHNDFGWTDQQPYAYAFNHFTSAQDGLLKSVSFYTTNDSVSYTVKVYEQFQNGTLGQLAATVAGSEAFEGFHTIDLPGAIPMPQGQDFYIQLQTSNGQQANDGNISLQRLLDFQNVTGSAYTTSLSGQSFCSADGMNWTDLYSVDNTHSENFAIDGLTVAGLVCVPAGRAAAASTVQSNSYTIVTGTLNLSHSDAQALTGMLSIGANGVFNKSGSGTLTISAIQSHIPGAQLNLNGGVTVMNTDAGSSVPAPAPGSIGRTLVITTSGVGTTLVLTVTQHLAALSIGTGTNVALTAGGNGTFSTQGGKLIVTDALVIVGTGSLDLTNNALILKNAGTLGEDMVLGLLNSAYHGGLWNGPGLTSGLAAGDPAHHALGYALGSELGASYTIDGEAVGASDLVVAFTLLGDSTLAGSASLPGFNATLNHIGSDGDWFDGNFHYGSLDAATNSIIYDANGNPEPGAVDFTDLNAALNNIGSFFGNAAPAATVGNVPVVPESSSLGLLAMGLLTIVRRARSQCG